MLGISFGLSETLRSWIACCDMAATNLVKTDITELILMNCSPFTFLYLLTLPIVKIRYDATGNEIRKILENECGLLQQVFAPTKWTKSRRPTDKSAIPDNILVSEISEVLNFFG